MASIIEIIKTGTALVSSHQGSHEDLISIVSVTCCLLQTLETTLTDATAIRPAFMGPLCERLAASFEEVKNCGTGDDELKKKLIKEKEWVGAVIDASRLKSLGALKEA